MDFFFSTIEKFFRDDLLTKISFFVYDLIEIILRMSGF